jgi:hypothetical protein
MLAQQNGLIGLIIYSDPIDDGYLEQDILVLTIQDMCKVPRFLMVRGDLKLESKGAVFLFSPSVQATQADR